jgi:hypothetical protein
MAKKSQIDKFREAARAHEADENEDKFNDALRTVTKHRPPEPQAPRKTNQDDR